MIVPGLQGVEVYVINSAEVPYQEENTALAWEKTSCDITVIRDAAFAILIDACALRPATVNYLKIRIYVDGRRSRTFSRAPGKRHVPYGECHYNGDGFEENPMFFISPALGVEPNLHVSPEWARDAGRILVTLQKARDAQAGNPRSDSAARERERRKEPPAWPTGQAIVDETLFKGAEAPTLTRFGAAYSTTASRGAATETYDAIYSYEFVYRAAKAELSAVTISAAAQTATNATAPAIKEEPDIPEPSENKPTQQSRESQSSHGGGDDEIVFLPEHRLSKRSIRRRDSAVKDELGRQVKQERRSEEERSN